MSLGNYICGTCGCNNGTCGCGANQACQPANTIYESTCADPGTLTVLKHLLGLDAQFCKRRLVPSGSGGFLVARMTPNGWAISFSTAPTVALEEFLAVQGVAFGQVLVQQSDSVMRAMNPPVTANLVLGTNAAGQAMWIPIPAATVPDPLTVADLTVTNLATINNLEVTGTPVLSGLGTGALVSFLGLDASDNVIKGTPATTGVQTAMFYETPTSPGGTSPNEAVAPLGLLTIGNLLNESVLPAVPGGALITPTNSQTLTVLTPGWYNFDACAQINGTNEIAYINFQINGITVNTGNSTSIAAQATTQRIQNWTAFASRRMAAGDTITLQLGPALNAKTYAVRIRATRTGS